MRRNFSRIAGLLEIADKEFNEIRESLKQYKKNVEDKISTQELFDSEIDAVILETLIKQDSNILKLNSHIKDLVGMELEPIDDFSAKTSIQHLKWFNITTFKQLSRLILKYTDTAIAISSEKFKDFRPNENTKVNKTISFFYLCYAILLSEYCDVHKIEKYLSDEHIGGDAPKRKIAIELYKIAKELNLGKKSSSNFTN